MDLHNRSNQFMLDNEGTRCHRHESILHSLPHPFPIWPDRAGKVMDPWLCADLLERKTVPEKDLHFVLEADKLRQ
ncbi:uncharacterized protein LOC113575624 [Electrophorus electricus]|uniref:uncharacterized protein LOC113575624 n=1 Tax=Electrophorus electricus TaxID=8005 RepID=UPI0015D040B3|nr:uncharacterized protein LOC113575624 [Electrophorus electricus]